MHKSCQILLVLSLLLAISIPVAAQEPADVTAYRAFIEAELARHAIPGAGYALVQDGAILDARGFGVDGYGDPLEADTPLRIGSLSKSFTALAVMQLVDAGEIELDAPVRRYLTEFTLASGDPNIITVRHLLYQISGLSDAGYTDSFTMTFSTPLEVRVTDLTTAEMTSEPGTSFAYFNANYDTLGLLIERVSGQPYEDYITEAIFTPLGMDNSFFLNDQTMDQVAPGYIALYSMPIPLQDTLAVGSPAGGIISTADDMARYLSFVTEGDPDVLSPAARQTLLSLPPTGYGMGWYPYTTPDADPLLLMHGGDTTAFHSTMLFNTDADRAVVLLLNQQHIIANFTAYTEMTDGLAALLQNQEPEANGISFRIIGIVLGVIVLIAVLFDLRAVMQARNWARRHKGQSWLRFLPGIIISLIPLLLLIFIPQIVLLLMGRAATFTVAFYYLPDLVLWLIIAAVFGLLKWGLRLYNLRAKTFTGSPEGS